MKQYLVKYDWMPPPKAVPLRVQKALLPFTPGVWGWTIYYRGRTRTVCPKTVDLAEVPARWEKLKAQIDEEAASLRPPPSGGTLREALGLYFEWLDYRVSTGKPKPLAAISAEDYKRNLTNFGRFSVAGKKFADMLLAEFGPEHFRPFAESLANRAPTSFARIVVTVTGFFNYCRDEGYIATLPNYGRYFVRPPQAQIRDRRLQQKKSFEVEELWTIIEHADVQEKAWIGMALTGAMDNADIGHLTFDLFDKTGLLLDYRRRKQGLMPRLIPVHPLAREWLDEYLRVRPEPADPAHKDLVFLTPTGLPLQRSTPGKGGVGNHIDYLAQCWDRLLRRAGLRAA